MLQTSKVSNSLVANGCDIEGTVENSILFRGVKVRKGAVVKNSIIMQQSEIEEGAVVENIDNRQRSENYKRSSGCRREKPKVIKKAEVI